MPRRLRYQAHPWQPFELTWRCAQSRFLMRPGREANRRIVGVLARATAVCGGDAAVRVYFAGGTCNHIHIIAAFRDAEAKAEWVGHARCNLSKELGDLYQWPGCHWDRRSSDIAILDDATFYQRLVYLAGQATRAGLVRHAADWPGVPWIQAVTEGRPLQGVWYDRTRLYRLRLAWAAHPKGTRGARPTLADVARPYTLALTPPPMWAGLGDDVARARWREVVATAEARDPPPRRVLGPAGVLRLNPHASPESSAHRPAPAVHASDRGQRRAWWAAYRAFVEAYRCAMHALRSGIERCAFPAEGCRPVRMARARDG